MSACRAQHCLLDPELSPGPDRPAWASAPRLERLAAIEAVLSRACVQEAEALRDDAWINPAASPPTVGGLLAGAPPPGLLPETQLELDVLQTLRTLLASEAAIIRDARSDISKESGVEALVEAADLASKASTALEEARACRVSLHDGSLTEGEAAGERLANLSAVAEASVKALTHSQVPRCTNRANHMVPSGHWYFSIGPSILHTDYVFTSHHDSVSHVCCHSHTLFQSLGRHSSRGIARGDGGGVG